MLKKGSSLTLALAGVLIAALVTGCSSSDSTSTGATGTTSSGQLAAAKSAVAKAEASPTGLGSRTPLSARPAAGKTVVFLQCELQQCHNYEQGVADAAAAVGWKTQVINYNSANEATTDAGFKAALRYSPAAVVYPGNLSTLTDSVLAPYKSAKVPVISISGVPSSHADAIPVVVFNQTFVDQVSAAVANWFIADSGGKGNTLIVDLPYIGVLHAMAVDWEKDVKAGCSGCASSTLDITPTQLANNNSVAAVVSAVRKNPKLTHVLVVDGALFPGLSGALRTAGVRNVKVAGLGPSTANISALKAGTEAAWLEAPDAFSGWAAVDAAIRLSQGATVPDDDGGLPFRLVDSSNASEASDDGAVNAPANYQTLFKQLWKVA